MRILLLGGTGEARTLARVLADRHDVISSLAGRLNMPELPAGQVRIGGFGGVDGLVNWLRENAIDAVVDATHPFAAAITANAVTATRRMGVPLLVLRRPQWEPSESDRWDVVDDLAAARAQAESYGTPVFLTVGRQELATFATLPVAVARVIDPPGFEIPGDWVLIQQRGPFTVAEEREVMLRYGIGVLVTKNSGGEQTSAKLAAAQQLGVPVVMVRRPLLPRGTVSVASVSEAAQWVDGLLRAT